VKVGTAFKSSYCSGWSVMFIMKIYGLACFHIFVRYLCVVFLRKNCSIGPVERRNFTSKYSDLKSLELLRINV
jgi:hypothetical protein